MLGWLADYPNQLRLLYPAGVKAGRDAVRRARSPADKSRHGTEATFTGVLVLGTGGGSAAGAYVAASLVRSRLKVPFEVAQGYDPPAYALADGARPFIIAVSHSGQTEETLSAVSALPTSAWSRMIVVTAGGRLLEEAARRKIPCVTLPEGMQARAVTPGIVAALLGLLDGAGLTTTGFAGEIEEAASLTAELAVAWSPAAAKGEPRPVEAGTAGAAGTAAAAHSPSPIQLARLVVDRLLLVYGGAGATEGVARRWKNQLAENGKTLAHWYTIPEAHHDEVVGWDAPSYIREHIYACFLRDAEAETPKMARRLDVSRDLLAKRMTGVTDVWALGRGSLARALSLCLYGDYLSCYVALLRGIDPTPVPIIVELKREVAAVPGTPGGS
jgi:glucose/mannose-6-phosphate isomerase